MIGVSAQQLPKGWSLKRLDFVATVKARLGWKGLTASEYVDDGYVFLSTPNIKGREIDFDNVNYISAERYLESPEIMLRSGDVLLAKDGSTLGICSVVRHLPRPATVNGSIAVIRPTKEIDPIFLHYVFTAPEMQALIRQFKDGMGVPHLFQSDLRKFRVIVPPLVEQQAIAAFLDAKIARIDELTRAKQRLMDALEARRKQIINDAVCRGLDPTTVVRETSVRWFGLVPRHWDCVQLRRVILRFVDYRGRTPEKVAEGVPLVTAVNIKNGRIDLDLGREFMRGEEYEDWMVRGLPEIGDVLVTTEAPLGEVAQVENEHIALAQRIILLKADKKKVTNEYLKYFFLSAAGQGELWTQASGSTALGIKASRFKGIAVLLPPLDEQKEITRHLEEALPRIDSMVRVLREDISRVSEYRSALISAAVIGQIQTREGTPEEATAICL